MKLVQKMVLAAATVMVTGAASFPNEIGEIYRGTYPTDMRKAEALKTCQANNPTFVRFLAGDREDCYAKMRIVSMPGEYSGVWSKHDHRQTRLAMN